MRRGSIVALLGIGLIAGGVATAVALVPTWLPKDASREAGRIDFVFWFVIAICIAIFSLVAAVMIYAILRFRVRPDDHEDGPPVHGHTGLEITWTAIPFVLVTAIAIASSVVLAQDSHAGRNPLKIVVTTQQFAYQFTYPNGKTFYDALRIPVGRHVKLTLNSNDVIHSFWVPQFAQKSDAVPGLHNVLDVTPTKTGVFAGRCAEYCGLDHWRMDFQARVVTLDEFRRWAQAQPRASLDRETYE